MEKNRKTPVSFTLTDFELECIRELAKRQDRSRSYVAGKAIMAMMEDLDPEAFRTLAKNTTDDSLST